MDFKKLLWREWSGALQTVLYVPRRFAVGKSKELVKY